MVDVKCMSWARLKNDELIYNICMDRFGLYGKKSWLIKGSDINFEMELGSGSDKCPFPNQLRIGRWCAGVRLLSFSSPMRFYDKYYHSNLIETIEDLVNGIENVIGKIPHSWLTRRICVDIPFCKTISELRHGYSFPNGEIYVKFWSHILPKSVVEYDVVFPSQNQAMILVRKYDIKWLIRDDFGIELTSPRENLDRLGVLGKELNDHALLVAKIAEKVIDKSCDIVNGVVNSLIEYFAVHNLYP